MLRVPLFRERPSLKAPRSPRRRVLAILAPTQAGVKTVRALGRRLAARGIALEAASECHGEVKGERGEVLHPNLLLVEAAQRKWDALLVAGGRGARRVAEDAFARDLIKRGTHVAAFGEGAEVLARAGVEGFRSDDVKALARWLCEAV
jgi:putative intracellular protease/amidase